MKLKNLIIFILISIPLALLFSCEKKEAKESVTSKSLFQKVSSTHSGITFTNNVKERFENYFAFYPYIYNGGGVAVGDINKDGLEDIYFTANEHANKLYLNKGDMKFEDITAAAGVEGKSGWDNGVQMVDINHDGYLDIYIARGGWQDTDEERKNLLYVNNGDLTFTEQASEYGLDDMAYSIHASFFDMDNDNDLDAYVINRPDSFYLPITTMEKNRYIPNDYFRDKLYRNDNGKYTEIGLQAGITENFGYSLSVMTSDFNLDGYKDIFVANDYSERDFLFINQGDGTFVDKMEEAAHHISLASMGCDMADINNDGLEDLVVLEMQPADYRRSKVCMIPMDIETFDAIQNSGMYKQYLHSMMFLNMGDAYFSEIGHLAGMTDTDWSWGCLTSDYDNDGFRDLFIANGVKRDVMYGDIQMKITNFINQNRHRFKSSRELFQNGFDEFINLYDVVKLRNYFYKNNGDLTFKDVSTDWGMDEIGLSNGSAIADFDKDGDLDIVVNNFGEEAYLLENTQSGNNFLQIELEGPDNNPFGLGAYITLFYDGQIQFFENKTVRGYLSSSTPVPHFGMGETDLIDSIRVRWTDGKENVVKNVKTNQLLKLSYSNSNEGGSQILERNPDKKSFEEVTQTSLKPKYKHQENELFEYADQKLLPHQFSKSGPFISTGDINGDGLEDFFVGGAKDQAGGLYMQKNGAFTKVTSSALNADRKYEDMGSALFDVDGDGDLDLYVVSGGSEFEEGHELYQDRIYLNNGKGMFSKGTLPETISSGSCVVADDIDNDGDIDVFVGGQVVAHWYPNPPKSYLFINENGNLVDKTEALAPELSRVGMVNSAVFTDLDGDSQKELIVVGEWMPIKIFEFSENKFQDQTAQYAFSNSNGWWNKIVSEDLDGDGDQDLIVGNLGDNYNYMTSRTHPFQVFAKDFDRNGTNDIFLAYFHDNTLRPVRGLDVLRQQLPVMNRFFPTFESFAQADMKGILGNSVGTALHLYAYEFSSIILINENGQLKQKKLPVEAQFSTLNSIIVQDYNKDGIKDLIIGGNMFDVEVVSTPADASPGFILEGKGNFEYQAVMPYESGFFIPYNVKDIQWIKGNQESYILVASNDDELRIFKSLN